MQKIEFFKHTIGAEEKEAMLRAMDEPFLTTGTIVADFEHQFAAFVGADHAVGLTSCTAALHLALLACGVGPGDEVITTPMTFAATSLAIAHCGAKPVWVDVEPLTGNMNAESIEAAITSRTKAILPVHLYGQMCNMLAISRIAKKHSLYIIEDAAHALIARRAGIKVGQLSDACCFSFYATKSITCGEGGALTTNNTDIFEYVKRNRSHGLTSDAAARYSGTYTHWDIVDLGWKYNMDNLKASMLIPQLAKADHQRAIRKIACEVYMDKLHNIKQLSFPIVLPECISDYHLFTLWVDQRDDLITYLQNHGIGVTVNYRSINLLSALLKEYGKGRGSFPNSEYIGDRTLSLPLHCKLTDAEMSYVCSTLKKFFG